MKTNKLAMFLLMLPLLTACSKFEITIGTLETSNPTLPVEIPVNTPTLPPPVQSSPTAVIIMPSPTSVLPAATQDQPPSPTPVPTQPSEQTVKLFMIVLEDNGRSGPLVGCGDSAVPIKVVIPKTQAVLRATLEKLLAEKVQFYEGDFTFYNALYNSDLQLADVTIEQEKAIIHLTGQILLGGTCDAPRLEAQIEQTALQFSTVKDVAVFLNDVPLEEALSQK